MKLNNDGMGRYLTNIVVLFTADFFVVDPIKEEDKPKMLKDKPTKKKDENLPSSRLRVMLSIIFLFIFISITKEVP